jgi:hypothetical protein
VAKRVGGAVRVGAWLSVVGLALGFGVMRSAHADIRSSSLAFGNEINNLVDESGAAKDDLHLKLNGQSVFVHQSFVPKSVHEVVQEYETFCRQNPGALGQMWGKGPFLDSKQQPLNLPNGMEAGIIKEEGQKEGMLICLSKGANSATTMAEAVARFDKSQDLGEFGRLRYVYVKSAGARSKVMSVWTEDSFRFKDLSLEGTEDAIGSDGQLPRLEGSRRVLDVEVVGTPYQVRVYEVKQDRGQVAAFYDGWAKRNDFRALAPEVADNQKLRGYFRGGSQVLVGAFVNPDGKTYTSIAEVWPKNGDVARVGTP